MLIPRQKQAEQAEARRFLKLVDNASQALFPGVKRYDDLTHDQKTEVCAFLEWLHAEVTH